MPICRCVLGIVVEAGTVTPQAGVRVRLVTSKGRSTVALAEATTDKAGRFSIDISGLSGNDTSGVYELKVFDGVVELEAHGDVRWSAATEAKDLVVCVSWPEACAAPQEAPPQEIVGQIDTDNVHGVVRHVDGTPLVGLDVSLWEVTFNGETQLVGPVQTLAEGWFSIGPVTTPPNRDLYVKVYEPGTPPRLVGTSKVSYGYAGGALRLHVAVCDEALRGPSEFSRITLDLSSVIFPGAPSHPDPGLPGALVGMDVRKVAWTAARTKWSLDKIADRALAERLDQALSAPGSIVGAEPLYGLLREGFPKTAKEVLARPPSIVAAALGRAKTANVIGLGVGVQDVLDALVEAVGRALDDGNDDALGEILRTSQTLSQPQALTDPEITQFCELYAGFDGTDDAFWAQVTGPLPDGLNWATAKADEARRLVRLGTLGLGHAPTVLAILKVLNTAPAEVVGGWSATTWNGIAGWPTVGTDSVSPLPEGLDGALDEDKRKSLSRLLMDHAAMAFPARALHAALSGSVGSTLGVANAFARNPTLDIRTVAIYASNPAIDFDGNEATEVPALRTAQRLVRIAPAVDSEAALQRLADAEISSARDIARRGKARFVETYTGGDPALEAEAREIVVRAQSQAAMAGAFLLSAHPALGRASLGFVPSKAVTVTDADLPGWSDLFTPPTGTRCAWCQSIHGPSAYLVDLLHWLSSRTPPSTYTSTSTPPWTSALDALLARRPDLADLPLTCENAERVLPTIDLTLEILEGVVSEEGIGSAKSSEAEGADMLAAPQYTIDGAYDVDHLGSYKRSFAAPFHQPLSVARPFLAHLGIARTDLMRAFAADVADIAKEELGLSTEAASAVTHTPSGTAPDTEEAFWSFTIPPAAADELTVKVFRRSAEVDYEQILDLLHTRLANPASGVDELVVLMETGGDPYDISSYSIQRIATTTPTYTAPTTAQFTAMRKVLRLWKATGWTLLDLDRVCAALGESDPAAWDDGALTAVGDFHRLAAMTGLSPVELSGWFGSASHPHGVLDTYEDRDTREHPSPSLYDRTWLNPSLFPLAEQQDASFPFTLNGTRDEVDTVSALREQLAKLHAVLQVDETEVEDLIDALEAAGAIEQYDPGTGAVAALNLRNLGLLTRWCSLARVLGLEPTDLVRLTELAELAPGASDAGPFTDPATAVDFIEDAREILGAGWTVEELDYLVRHERPDRVAPTDDWIRGVLGRLRDTARSFAEDVSDADRLDAFARQLSEEFGVARATMDALHASMFLGAANDGSVDSLFVAGDTEVDSAGVAELASEVQVVLTADVAYDSGTIPSGTTIIVPAATIVDGPVTLPAGTVCTIPSEGEIEVAGVDTTIAAGSAVVVPNDTAVTWGTSSSGTLTADASGTLGAEADIATIALLTFADPDDVVSTSLLSRFLRTTFTDPTTTDESDPWSDILRSSADWREDYAVLDALHKAVLLQARLGADEDERAAWVARVSDWSLLDPAFFTGRSTALRLPTSGATAAFTWLRATIDLFRQRDRLPGSTPSFAEVIEAPTSANLAERTGWDEGALDTLVGAGITSVSDLDSVLDRMDFVRRAGAAPEVVQRWAAAGSLAAFTTTESGEIVAAARSKHPDANAWSRIARPLRDPVRKAQRDALVSYLIAEDGWSGGDLEDADDLYEHYLIDVSMNPEMLTSRIVQATLAVQLFVHRALFGLELDDTDADLGEWFNDEDRAEWEWMRTYRVWEAARKVFLYPENWIEPELRDDKTPFFRALEQSLAQGDATEERVEQVTLDYLDRLLSVGSLEVLACFHEKESDDDGTVDRFHVFARTRGEPASFWYRRREDASTWSPWDEIKAGIEGDHLLPVVYNRRLMLFWAEFTETQSENENADPQSWWEIRLAMSEYRDGKWSPKRLGSEALALSYSWVDDKGLEKAAKSAYGFVSEIEDDGTLTIRCIGARSAGAIALQSVFYELGKFSLNTCTMDLTVSRNVTETAASRVALDPTRWVAPGYSNLLYDENLEYMDDLDVYLGEVDEDGALVGSASPVDVLDQIEDARVVVPSQWGDFVSQSPFFVSVGERVYFVEPKVDDDDDLETATVADSPPVSGLSSFRAGTRAAIQEQGGTPLSDDDALALTVYVDSGTVRSTDAAVSALKAVDSAFLSSAPSATVTGRLGSYRFWPFYHPYVCRFIKEVRREGVFGLVDPDPDGTAGDLFRQALQGDPDDFEDRYQPTDAVVLPYPVEEIDFSLEGAYSPYNWELFFHLPFYVANRLADAGRFQEAVDWFHAMFDPRTRTSAAESGFDGAVDNSDWWKVKPFLEPASQPVTDWIAFTGADGDEDAQASFEAQVAAWREEPFNPHALARLRPGTYQRALVMRYIDTLIAWGDALFTRDTLETLNEATQLYVFAKQVLGDRPELLGDAERPEAKTWDDLKGSLDDFSNPLVALENAAFSARGLGRSRGGSAVLGGVGFTTYFCVPFNAKLLSYWDTIDDRLFKIRNGMNIAGVVRSLPLFQPPIDPAMLVRAAAAGIDIGAALSDSASVGHYRFSVMIGRAQALAGSVRSLGQALLSALEKRDAEALAMLRQTHEGALFDAVKGVRERQVEEAKENLAALRKNRKVVEARRDYYQRLIDKGWLPKEEQASELTDTALTLDRVAASVSGINALMALIPEIAIGFALHGRTGGSNLSNALSATTSALAASSGALKTEAGRLTTTASYVRREQEWKNQRNLANKELGAVDKQIAAAEIRADVAKRELSNHELQIRHSEEVRAWMESKFTNAELYDWMVGQLATLYFQSWQLAYNTAKKAEACYQHELGRDDTFVQAVHWDGTKKGLLAGERLQLDLERMDAAYLDYDAREHELTKHVSLRLLDPLALVRLRADGECYFEIPEAHFDLDCPSHYFRRIQSVALSIACVAGPQGTVSARLTLHGARLRTDPDTLGDWETTTYPSVVTSVATQDAGVFSLDPKDARYLPFERSGAISRWHLKLTAQTLKQLDWAAIEDVALHLRYTARDDGTDREVNAAALATLQVGVDSDFGASVPAVDTGFVRLVSLQRDFAEDLVAAQQTNDTSVEVTVSEALRDPVTTQALVGILAVPIAANGSSSPTSLGLDHTAAAALTFGTGVSYHHWTSSLPDLDNAITLSHGSETSRQDPVLDLLADPPASPADGDRYLVAASGATGAWLGKEDNIAEYDEGTTSWTFTTPTTGMAVYIQDEAVVYIYDGSSWAQADWDFSDVDDLILVLLYE